MISFICISSAVNLTSINLHDCEANACRKKIITIDMPCQPYFKTDQYCLDDRFCYFVYYFFKYIIKFSQIGSMRDLSFTGCAELSYQFLTFTITFLTVHVRYTFGRCVLCTSVCLSVCQADLTWLDSSSRSVSVNSASRCSMLSWKLGLIVFLLSLLWTDRLSVKTIHKQ